MVSFRRWLNKYSGGQVDWGTKFSGELPPTPPREQLMDRWFCFFAFWCFILESISVMAFLVRDARSVTFFVRSYSFSRNEHVNDFSGTGHTRPSAGVAILRIKVWMQLRSRFKSWRLPWLELLLQQSRECYLWLQDIVWFQQLFCAFWLQNGYLILYTRISISMTMTMQGFELERDGDYSIPYKTQTNLYKWYIICRHEFAWECIDSLALLSVVWNIFSYFIRIYLFCFRPQIYFYK